MFSALLLAQPQRPVQSFPTSAGELKVTPIRHASMMIEAGGRVIHVDPWSQGNYTGLPKADIILITDIHGDHMDPKAIEIVRKPDTPIVAPPAVAETVKVTHILSNGESTTLGDLSLEAVPMYNEKRGPEPGKFYHEKGRGNGYILTYGGIRVYIAGDTEGTSEMRALKNIDVAFIPMNLPNTMSPEEAADAVKAFKPKIAIPFHYRNSDTQVFANALQGTGIEVRLLDWYY